MSNKNKDRVILILIFVITIYMFFACCYGTYKLFAQDKDEVIFTDPITETQYIQKSKYIEVKGTDGYVSYIGNNAELED